MMYRPGRLRRVLTKLGFRPDSALLAVDAYGLGSWDDDRIQSVTMTRGSRTQAGGIMPGTASVTIDAALPTSVDSVLEVRLADYLLAEGLASHLNASSLGLDPGAFIYRWVGRIAAQTVTDKQPDQQATQLKAGFWSSLYTDTGVTVIPQNNDPGKNGLHLPVFYTQAWNLAK